MFAGESPKVNPSAPRKNYKTGSFKPILLPAWPAGHGWEEVEAEAPRQFWSQEMVLGVSETRGPQYGILNSRILSMRTPK